MTSEVFREFFFNELLDFKNLDEDTIVIFDTNTLLNIYRYSNDTRAKLIEAIKQIKNNIWMPYQVGLEFNLNRRGVIEKLKNGQEKQKQDIHKAVEKNINVLSQHITNISLKSTDAKSKKNEINKFIEEKLTSFNTELTKKVEELYGMLDLEKDLASEIATIFDGKIGKCYTQEELNEKLKDAETRYERKIPPGYEDSEKTETTYYNGIEFENKYGDLIVWNQILDAASAENINKVVFVTDDNKEDWWYSCERKTIGARAELKNEMQRIAKADFYMLNANGFLNNFSESEETKDLIENEVTSKSRLDDPIYQENLDSSLKFESIKSMKIPLELLEVEQDKNITISNSKIYKSLYSDMLRREEERQLRQMITDLNQKIYSTINYRETLITDLQKTENEYQMLISDSNVPLKHIENMSRDIENTNKILKSLNSELEVLNNRYVELKNKLDRTQNNR